MVYRLTEALESNDEMGIKDVGSKFIDDEILFDFENTKGSKYEDSSNVIKKADSSSWSHSTKHSTEDEYDNDYDYPVSSSTQSDVYRIPLEELEDGYEDESSDDDWSGDNESDFHSDDWGDDYEPVDPQEDPQDIKEAAEDEVVRKTFEHYDNSIYYSDESWDHVEYAYSCLSKLKALEPSLEDNSYSSMIALETIAESNGVSLENYEDYGFTVSLEEQSESIFSKIWTAIKNFFKGFFSKIKDMFKWFTEKLGLSKKEEQVMQQAEEAAKVVEKNSKSFFQYLKIGWHKAKAGGKKIYRRGRYWTLDKEFLDFMEEQDLIDEFEESYQKEVKKLKRRSEKFNRPAFKKGEKYKESQEELAKFQELADKYQSFYNSLTSKEVITLIKDGGNELCGLIHSKYQGNISNFKSAVDTWITDVRKQLHDINNNTQNGLLEILRQDQLVENTRAQRGSGANSNTSKLKNLHMSEKSTSYKLAEKYTLKGVTDSVTSGGTTITTQAFTLKIHPFPAITDKTDYVTKSELKFKDQDARTNLERRDYRYKVFGSNSESHITTISGEIKITLKELKAFSDMYKDNVKVISKENSSQSSESYFSTEDALDDLGDSFSPSPGDPSAPHNSAFRDEEVTGFWKKTASKFSRKPEKHVDEDRFKEIMNKLSGFISSQNDIITFSSETTIKTWRDALSEFERIYDDFEKFTKKIFDKGLHKKGIGKRFTDEKEYKGTIVGTDSEKRELYKKTNTTVQLISEATKAVFGIIRANITVITKLSKDFAKSFGYRKKLLIQIEKDLSAIGAIYRDYFKGKINEAKLKSLSDKMELAKEAGADLFDVGEIDKDKFFVDFLRSKGKDDMAERYLKKIGKDSDDD